MTGFFSVVLPRPHSRNQPRLPRGIHPKEVKTAALRVLAVKGLDFHSACYIFLVFFSFIFFWELARAMAIWNYDRNYVVNVLVLVIVSAFRREPWKSTAWDLVLLSICIGECLCWINATISWRKAPRGFSRYQDRECCIGENLGTFKDIYN